MTAPLRRDTSCINMVRTGLMHCGEHLETNNDTRAERTKPRGGEQVNQTTSRTARHSTAENHPIGGCVSSVSATRRVSSKAARLPSWAPAAPIVALFVLTLAEPARGQPIDSVTPLAFDALDRDRDAPANEDSNYYSDGVYGRFDGELSLVPSLGVQRSEAGGFTQIGLSAFYLSTVGVTFRTAEGSLSPWSPRANFNVSTLSLAVRPLFLLRWSQDWEKGPSFLDLTIDSLTLSLGGYWAAQRSDGTQHRGFESELSLGFPILGEAHGPWLTLSVANRLPRVTHANRSVDMIYGVRLEWSFSLGS